MDMNTSFVLRKEDRAPKWQVIDAKGKVLGRLSTQIADILRGKNKPYYTPHTDCGDYVVVINAEKITLTGNKLRDKTYVRVSGWVGGKKETTVATMLEKDPTYILKQAVKRMLPKNKLNRHIFKKLRVYAGSEHPHHAQISS